MKTTVWRTKRSTPINPSTSIENLERAAREFVVGLGVYAPEDEAGIRAHNFSIFHERGMFVLGSKHKTLETDEEYKWRKSQDEARQEEYRAGVEESSMREFSRLCFLLLDKPKSETLPGAIKKAEEELKRLGISLSSRTDFAPLK